ncbi:predicted protein [Haematococcus lacustris]|uniref:U1-type domain-containing protein n=1 Tax=Haematococcus lacustris TaxID=44745 RepID=A0A699YR47_HAELA|nr:predicted protein [Haematococcus lacustris]
MMVAVSACIMYNIWLSTGGRRRHPPHHHHLLRPKSTLSLSQRNGGWVGSKRRYRMTEAWRSNAMHWCDVCKCWLNDTKAAKAHHEQGMGHKANLARTSRRPAGHRAARQQGPRV